MAPNCDWRRTTCMRAVNRQPWFPRGLLVKTVLAQRAHTRTHTHVWRMHMHTYQRKQAWHRLNYHESIDKTNHNNRSSDQPNVRTSNSQSYAWLKQLQNQKQNETVDKLNSQQRIQTSSRNSTKTQNDNSEKNMKTTQNVRSNAKQTSVLITNQHIN